jgi:hypothetical protein
MTVLVGGGGLLALAALLAFGLGPLADRWRR